MERHCRVTHLDGGAVLQNQDVVGHDFCAVDQGGVFVLVVSNVRLDAAVGQSAHVDDGVLTAHIEVGRVELHIGA